MNFTEIFQRVDPQFVVYVVAFVGVLLIFEGLRQMVSRSESAEKAKSRRMQLIQKGASTEEILKILKPTEKRSFVERLPFVGDLPLVLRQAGIVMAPGAFLVTCLAAAVAIFVLAAQFITPINAAGLGVIVGIVIPILQVRMKRTERMNLLVKQMPDALDLMARGLKVGHPLNTTLSSVANERQHEPGFAEAIDYVSVQDAMLRSWESEKWETVERLSPRD